MLRLKELFARVETRIFLVAWIFFTVHFATNIVREHYPAFSLVEQGNFQLDEYEGLHSDIFVHTDGHAYICNQVGTSVLAALPLLVFDPVLDALQRHSLAQLEASGGEVDLTYESEYPGRQRFYRLVREKGLDLRLGASAAITSTFFMAPLCALAMILVFRVLSGRGIARRRAIQLAFLFGFGTPIFYRAGILSGNFVLTLCVFASFLLIWRRPDEGAPVSTARRFWGGVLGGYGLVVDYAAAVSLPLLFGYLVFSRTRAVGLARASREALPYFLGSLPPVFFLWFTQWAMFGDPFLPAQSHMPVVNFTDRGFRGFDWPDLDLFWMNLASPNYGLFPWAPILALAFLPLLGLPNSARVLGKSERRFVWTYVALFLLFCAANQYARMQWNTGFRYLLTLNPFLFLLASDHLARIPERIFWIAALPALLHSWVMSQVRYTVGTMEEDVTGSSIAGTWQRFLEDGVQLPWLNVLRQTKPEEHIVQWFGWPYLILVTCVLVSLAIWSVSSRLERRLGV